MIYGAMKANVTDEVNKIKFIDSDYYEKFVCDVFRTQTGDDKKKKYPVIAPALIIMIIIPEAVSEDVYSFSPR